MIYLYTGKTGRGKTYKVVHEIYKNKLYKKHVIYHNIDGLKSDAFGPNAVIIDFRVYCNDNKITPSQFFTIPENTKIFESARDEYNKTLMIIVDECHQWFGNKNDEILTWVAYTRHLATFLCLVTQSEMMLHHSFRKIVDLQIRANVKFLGFFVYNKLEGVVGTGFQFAKASRKIFDLYTSAEIITKSYGSYIYAFILIVVLVGGWFVFQNIFADKADEEKKKHIGSKELIKSFSPVISIPISSRSYSVDPDFDYVGSACIYDGHGDLINHRTRHYVRDLAFGYVSDLAMVRPDYIFLRFTPDVLYVRDRITKELRIIVRRVLKLDDDKKEVSGS